MIPKFFAFPGINYLVSSEWLVTSVRNSLSGIEFYCKMLNVPGKY